MLSPRLFPKLVSSQQGSDEHYRSTIRSLETSYIETTSSLSQDCLERTYSRTSCTLFAAKKKVVMQLLVFNLKPMTAEKKAQGLMGDEHEKARVCLQGQNHEGFEVQNSTTNADAHLLCLFLDLAHLPLEDNIKWLIEFPPAWSWFLTYRPGQLPRHLVDNSIWGPYSRSSAPASSSMASTPGSDGSAFQLPSATNPMATSTFPLLRLISHHSSRHRPFPFSQQLQHCLRHRLCLSLQQQSQLLAHQQPAHCLSQHQQPMPPVMPWQQQCVQQPLPMQQLQTFLQEHEGETPADPPTLVRAIARGMPSDQAMDLSMQRTWHIHQQEKQRRSALAQPAWKAEMQRTQPSLSQPRLPVSSNPGAKPLARLHETEEERVVHLEDGHWSPPDGYHSSTSTQRADDARLDALDDDTSLETADWKQ